MNGNPPVILIVEDDEPSYLYLVSLLRLLPYTLLRAENGKEAVDYCIENQDIKMILMDLKMPVMDGLTSTRKIKAFRSDLPIIAITAYAFSSDERMAINAGCDEFLPKPVKKDLLFLKLEKFGIKRTE